jgi:AAA domain
VSEDPDWWRSELSQINREDEARRPRDFIRLATAEPKDEPPKWTYEERPGTEDDEIKDEVPHVGATPFKWRLPSTIPPRRFLSTDRHLVRGFVSCTIAPGGVGKSALGITETLSEVSGRDLLGHRPVAPLRVWLVNLEDPRDEIERRIAATMLHFQIAPAEIEGRLFHDSGRDRPMVIARDVNGTIRFDEDLIAGVKVEMKAKGIDVLRIDPFVACHGVPENDNGKIAAVVRRWAEIAEETNAAVELVHHTRKPATGASEITVDDGRGAVALIAGCRSVRVLNPMSKDEAERVGIEAKDRFRYFRSDNGKRNLAPAPDTAEWRRLASVELGNGDGPYPGDDVAVATAWTWPDATAGITVQNLVAIQKAIDGKGYRLNVQAADWIGKPVAAELGLDTDSKSDREKIKAAIRMWIGSGAFVTTEVKDAKGKLRPIVEVGKWAI